MNSNRRGIRARIPWTGNAREEARIELNFSRATARKSQRNFSGARPVTNFTSDMRFVDFEQVVEGEAPGDRGGKLARFRHRKRRKKNKTAAD